MNMNPMAMFGGFGAGGMGLNDMSGMNMGMGFNGGYGGNWNGQQNMGGNFGAGYYPNAGYNQQQMHQGAYGNQMHHQQFPNHNYQNRYQGQRGFGRGGRGGFGGRGGHVNQWQGQPNAAQYGNQQTDDTAFAHQLPGSQSDKALSLTGQESAAPASLSGALVDESQVGDGAPQDKIDASADQDANQDSLMQNENGESEQIANGDEMQANGDVQPGQDYEGKLYDDLIYSLFACL